MMYRDNEYAPEVGDRIEVYDEQDQFEPECAKVVKIGKNKLLVAWENEYIKPRQEWVKPDLCDLIAREG